MQGLSSVVKFQLFFPVTARLGCRDSRIQWSSLRKGLSEDLDCKVICSPTEPLPASYRKKSPGFLEKIPAQLSCSYSSSEEWPSDDLQVSLSHTDPSQGYPNSPKKWWQGLNGCVIQCLSLPFSSGAEIVKVTEQKNYFPQQQRSSFFLNSDI